MSLTQRRKMREEVMFDQNPYGAPQTEKGHSRPRWRNGPIVVVVLWSFIAGLLGLLIWMLNSMLLPI
jgi:hypothetical protein